MLQTSSVVSAQGDRANETEGRLKKAASIYFNEEDYAAAFPLYSQLLSLYPRDPNYNYRFGACLLFTQADKNKALTYLQFSIKQASVDNLAYYYLGRALHVNYKFGQAVYYYERFQEKASASELKKYPVDHLIDMCRSGETLVASVHGLEVLSKKELNLSDFVAGYDMRENGGVLIAELDEFKTKLDKQGKKFNYMYVTPDRDEAFFSSFGNDKTGGKNIYVVRRKRDGKWGIPENLGSVINSDYDEDYPVYDVPRHTLYFCSKGHTSIGGYDIFQSVYNEDSNTWSKPVNLDFPINATGDDILFVPDSLGQTAYFASTRTSAQGKITVYKISLEAHPPESVMIVGAAHKNDGITPVACKITVTDSSGFVGVYTSSPTDGRYYFSLPKGGNYNFTVETANNKSQSQWVALARKDGMSAMKEDLQLSSSGNLQISNSPTTMPKDSAYINYIKQQAEMDVNMDTASAKRVSLTQNSGDNAGSAIQKVKNTDANAENINTESVTELAKDEQALNVQGSRAIDYASDKLEEAAQMQEQARRILNKFRQNGSSKVDADSMAAVQSLLNQSGTSEAKGMEAYQFAVQYKNQAAAKQLVIDKVNASNGISDDNSEVSTTRLSPGDLIRIQAAQVKEDSLRVVFANDALDQDIGVLRQVAQNFAMQAQQTTNADQKAALLKQKDDLVKSRQEKEQEIKDNDEQLKELHGEYSWLKNKALKADSVFMASAQKGNTTNTINPELQKEIDEYTASYNYDTDSTGNEENETANNNSVQNGASKASGTNSLKGALRPSQVVAANQKANPKNKTRSNSSPNQIVAGAATNTISNPTAVVPAPSNTASAAVTPTPSNTISENQNTQVVTNNTSAVVPVPNNIASESQNTQVVRNTASTVVPTPNNTVSENQSTQVATNNTSAVVPVPANTASTVVPTPNSTVNENQNLQAATNNTSAVVPTPNSTVNENQNLQAATNNTSAVVPVPNNTVSENQSTQVATNTATAVVPAPNNTISESQNTQVATNTATAVVPAPSNTVSETQNIQVVSNNASAAVPASNNTASEVVPAPSNTASESQSTQVVTNTTSAVNPASSGIANENQNSLTNDNDTTPIINADTSTDVSSVNTTVITNAIRNKGDSGPLQNYHRRKYDSSPIAGSGSDTSVPNNDIKDNTDTAAIATNNNTSAPVNNVKPDIQVAATNIPIEKEAVANTDTSTNASAANTAVITNAIRNKGDSGPLQNYHRRKYDSSPIADSGSITSTQGNDAKGNIDTAVAVTNNNTSSPVNNVNPDIQVTPTNIPIEKETIASTDTSADMSSANTAVITNAIRNKGVSGPLQNYHRRKYESSPLPNDSSDNVASEEKTGSNNIENTTVATNNNSSQNVSQPAVIDSKPIAEVSSENSSSEENNSAAPPKIKKTSHKTNTHKHHTGPLRKNTNIFGDAGSSYSASNPIPVDPPLPEGLIFNIQVGAFRKPIPQDLFHGFQPVVALKGADGYIRYSTGLYTALDTAKIALKKVRALGYPDAFIIAFYNGKRISIPDALAKLAASNAAIVASAQSSKNNSIDTAKSVATKVSSAQTTNDVLPPDSVPIVVAENTITPSKKTLISERKRELKAINDTVAPAAKSINEVKGLVFTVQVGSFAKSKGFVRLRKMRQLYTWTDGKGFVKYNSGIYNGIADAKVARAIIVANTDVKDAFITAYYNGNRISLTEAAGLLNRGVKTGSSEPGAAVETTEPQKSTTATEATTAKPVNVFTIASETRVIYTVQIGSFAGQLPVDMVNKILKYANEGIEPQEEENGITSYYVGEFPQYEQARGLQQKLINEGFQQAFIVAYYQGKKISTAKARAIK